MNTVIVFFCRENNKTFLDSQRQYIYLNALLLLMQYYRNFPDCHTLSFHMLNCKAQKMAMLSHSHFCSNFTKVVHSLSSPFYGKVHHKYYNLYQNLTLYNTASVVLLASIITFTTIVTAITRVSTFIWRF